MPSTEELIQRTIHAAEVGELAVWLRRVLVAVAVVGLALFHLLHQFRGMAAAPAMDQAQIGRELARGHGWATKFIRPLAVGEAQRRGGDLGAAIGTDTYHAPLPPLLNAVALLAVKADWKMSPSDFVYAGDRAIAALGVLLFLGSVGVLYLIAVRLFDRVLAGLACGLVLVCDMMWQYSLSGLPQMLLLLLFHATVYALVRALQDQYAEGSPHGWLAGAGLGFGLLALSHALTIWIFVPALIFAALFFRRGTRAALILLGVFLVVYSPWLVRNYRVCGNPAGLAIYAALDGVRHSEAGQMRRLDVDAEGLVPGYFVSKAKVNLVTQFNRIFEYLGWSFVAPLALVSLLHAFKRRETATLRWLLLAMWFGAVLGMAVFGLQDEQGVAANQLHLLFMPLLTCYGLAFLMVQWNRRETAHPLFRRAFLTLLFVLCGLPTIFALLNFRAGSSVRWPPYLPPYLGVLGEWMEPEEIVASDMPWAVAWYADRRSVWVPDTVKRFIEWHDFETLGGPINGLYLTPVSGSENKLADLLKGEYRGWTAFIVRTAPLDSFPLKWAIPHGPEECILYTDRDRRPPHPAR